LNVGDIPVRIVSCHLAAGTKASNSETRLRQLALIARELVGCGAFMVVGDLNIRDDECEEAAEKHGWQDAGNRRDCTWCPTLNAFHANLRGVAVKNHRFDRILYRGACCVETFLVAKAKMYRDGKPFCLSDHFGVIGVCDVAALYAEDVAVEVVRERRKLLGDRRKAEVEAEVRFVSQRQMVDREQAALMKFRAEDVGRAEGRAALRRVRGGDADRQQEAYKAAFLDNASMWHPRRQGQFPVCGVPVAGVAVSGVGRSEKVDFVPHTALANIGCEHGQRFHVGILQALLRIASVVGWVRRHEAAFGSGCKSSGRACGICSLRGLLDGIGVRGYDVGSAALGALMGSGGGVAGEQDVSVLFREMLLSWHMRERGVGRAAEWPGVGSGCWVTEVEHVFGFVEETRMRCCTAGCGGCNGASRVACQLQLHVAGAGVSMSELYIRYASQFRGASVCKKCGQESEHVEQRRVVSLSDVLVISFEREDLSEGSRSLSVALEEEWSLPGVAGVLELVAVVFRSGKGDRAQCRVAVRGPDRFWWMFSIGEGGNFRRYGGSISGVLGTSVVMALYERSGVQSRWHVHLAGSAVTSMEGGAELAMGAIAKSEVAALRKGFGAHGAGGSGFVVGGGSGNGSEGFRGGRVGGGMGEAAVASVAAGAEEVVGVGGALAVKAGVGVGDVGLAEGRVGGGMGDVAAVVAGAGAAVGVVGASAVEVDMGVGGESAAGAVVSHGECAVGGVGGVVSGGGGGVGGRAGVRDLPSSSRGVGRRGSGAAGASGAFGGGEGGVEAAGILEGGGDLFAPGVVLSTPSVDWRAPWAMEIEVFMGLPSHAVPQEWSAWHLVSEGVPEQDGLRNEGNYMCYGIAAIQVLLRTPSVAHWLEVHRGLCGRGGEACATCALRATRDQLGQGCVAFLMEWRNSAVHPIAFNNASQQDAVEFVEAVLAKARDVELEAVNPVRFSGYNEAVDLESPFITQVERIFGFVEETRMQCVQCDAVGSRLAVQRMLRLSAPFVKTVKGGRVYTVSDLCRAYGVLDENPVPKSCGSDACSGASRRHRRQCRLASLPNVLLIQVKRFRRDGSKSHVRVSPDLALNLGGHGEGLALSGVVYHMGRNLRSGHYVAVNVDAEGRFWLYNDDRVLPLDESVEEYRTHEVYMLVYTRVGGFWRYGPEAVMEVAIGGSDGEAPGVDEDAASSASVAGRDSDGYAEVVGLESPPVRSPPCKRSRGSIDVDMPDVPSVETFPGQGADRLVGNAGGDVGMMGQEVGGQGRRSLRRTMSCVWGHDALAGRIPVDAGGSAAVMQKVVEELAEEVAAVSLAGGRSTSSSCGAVVGHGGIVVSRLWLGSSFFV
jgi:ubiquitin C-terminal hydrolase